MGRMSPPTPNPAKPRRQTRRSADDGYPRFPFGMLSILDLMGGRRHRMSRPGNQASADPKLPPSAEEGTLP